MTMSKTNRISYVDVFRGLLMLLVVLGHSIGNTDDVVNKTILSFHMPAFFILSGMCFHPKTNDFDTVAAIKKKAQGLIWPYITLSVIGVMLYWLLLAGTNKDLGVTVFQSIFGIVWNDGHIGTIVTGGFWFVYDLIWITFIHIVTKRIDISIRIVFTTLLFASLYLLDVKFYFSTEILRISVGYWFFLLGDIFARKHNHIGVRFSHYGGAKTLTHSSENLQSESIAELSCLSNGKKESFLGLQNSFIGMDAYKLKVTKSEIGVLGRPGGKLCFLWLIILVAITFGISANNDAILMYDNQYGKLPLFVLASLAGTTSVYQLAKAIDTNKILEFIGRNTLLILQIHFFVLMTTHVALHKVLPEVDNYLFPYYILHFIAAVLLCCGYTWVISKYCPWLLRWKIN